MTGIIGICMGNITWLIGLVLIGLGIWGVRISPKQVKTAVNIMGMATAGVPKGIALRLQQLVEPEDRTTKYGKWLIMAGSVDMIIGAWFIKACV